MNTKIIINLAAFALAVIGITFKFQHLPGANISILLSSVLMLCAVFMYVFKDNQEAGVPVGVNYMLTGVLAVLIIGAPWKMLHWPGANVFVYAGCALALLLPLILIFQKGDFKISKQFFSSFFTYFALLCSLALI